LSRQVGDMVARLRRQTDQLRAIFNLTPDGFIAFGADRRVQYISPACALLTALRDRDVLEQDEAGLAALLQGRFAEPEHQRPLRLQD
ncbi:PAS domain-containing protein, partial [Escherichia coli]|uniref:PAS domain-containing protein n=1 Tax=Escherichia coli TaxID=562 RepID=UPI001BDB90A5